MKNNSVKKTLALIIVFALLFTLTVPVSAQKSAKYDLKASLEIAKEKLSLNTAGYDFTSGYNENQEGRKTWELQWNHKTKGNISVSIDADTGEVTGVSQWTPTSGTQSRIPKYSKDAAIKAAKEIAAKLSPDKFKICILDEKQTPYAYHYEVYSDMYTFNFVRQQNGIPFQSNGITVGIDKNTLALRQYNLTWDNGPFPNKQAAISKDSAKDIFEKDLGIQLSYQFINSGDTQKPKPILVYSLKYGNLPINALTGEIIKNTYYGPVFDAVSAYYGLEKQAQTTTPQEQKVIEDASKYISKEKALEVAQKYIKIKENYKLSNASLYAGYQGGNANWSLSWNLQSQKNDEYGYIGAGIDAVTGELTYVYVNDSSQQKPKDTDPKYTQESAAEIATNFLQTMQPAKFKQTEYRESMMPVNSDKPTSYAFNFIRKVNGAACPSDGLNVTVDAYTGEIINYNMTWTNADFPAITGVMNLTDAYKALYSKSDLTLKYIKVYDSKYGGNTQSKLAYVLDNTFTFIDAKTGAPLDSQGNPIKQSITAAFTDIKGHYAEGDIKLLTEMGIITDSGAKYMPNDGIRQKDFIKMLILATAPYMSSQSAAASDTDVYYNEAIQRKIISASAKHPDAIVTRQEAAKMFVRAMGFGFVADINGIYLLGDKDAKTIKDSNKGAVVIVEKLGIMTAAKGYFYPTKAVTRGDMAAMLVKYLKIDFTVKD